MCRICFTALWRAGERRLLCTNCLLELDECSLVGERSRHPHVPHPICDIHSLWRYRGIMRDLILRAKVRQDQAALRLLIAMTVSRDELTKLVSWADVVIPAPSSLWGRLNGRLDIASLAADAIARDNAKDLRAAPSDLHWRWRKQARRRRGQRSSKDSVESFVLFLRSKLGLIGACSSDRLANPPRRVLLIDDVVTSGVTLQRTAMALHDKGASVVRCLTIAKS
ncbi:MAG: hypothetical protein FJ146_00435 [Deltaproteobacteria bacterium]|nr:hypothetical protein [Deltaproteobacteria bacterium]